MSGRAIDFTKGPIANKMLRFAGPLFLSNVLQTSYQFVDSLWVGNLLGADALAALSISAPITFAVLSFMIGINTTMLTILSQHRGQNDHDGIRKSLNAFVVILGTLSLILGLVGFVGTEFLLQLIGTPVQLMPMAKTYLQINFVGIIFLLGYNFISTVLRALGDSKTPLYIVLTAVLLNIVLDPLLISGFGWGMAGAAYATVAAQGLAFIYGVVYCILKGRVPFTRPCSSPTVPSRVTPPATLHPWTRALRHPAKKRGQICGFFVAKNGDSQVAVDIDGAVNQIYNENAPVRSVWPEAVDRLNRLIASGDTLTPQDYEPVNIDWSGWTWTSQDLNVLLPGGIAVDDDKLTIEASGHDIWGVRDGLRYTYVPVEGDFVATVRLHSVPVTDGWSKAGLMVRSASVDNAAHAGIMGTGTNGIVLQYRGRDQGDSGHAGQTSWDNGTPVFLRMERKGQQINTFTSSDGENWHAVASATIFLDEQALIGFAVTSHAPTNHGTAVFSDWSLVTGN